MYYYHRKCTTGAAVVTGQVLSGLLFKKIGHIKWQLVGCCVGFTAFLGGMAGVNASNRGVAIAVSSPDPDHVLCCELLADMPLWISLPSWLGFVLGL